MFIKQSSSRQLIFNIIERLSVSSWQKDLEVLHRIIGLLNKVQLCLYGKFSKSRCIAIYLFARWFITNRKKMGWLRVSLYLKSCSVCLMKAYGGTFNKHEPLSHPVSLTGSGLPRCIPSFHRHEILRRGEQSDQLVQLYLSLFSISKLILRVKSTSKMYKTIVDPPAVPTIWPDMDCVPDLMTRYCPQAFDIPMSLGLKVDLSWSSSPVSVTWLFRDKKARSPLHRLIWEFFAISTIDSIERVSRSIYLTPKNFIPSDPVKSVFGILSDWWPIGARCQSFLSMFFIQFAPSRMVFPRGRETLQLSSELAEKAESSLEALLLEVRVKCWRFLHYYGFMLTDKETLKRFPTGKLGFKNEGAGKRRIFAIPNALKQALMRPAHEWCMSILRLIPMDGTFDQTKPLERLKSIIHLYSFDLSAATDRFPISWQYDFVKELFGIDLARAWVRMGLGSNFFSTHSPRAPKERFAVRFRTGQPLGFLSSWPLFALCHHMVVWMCAERVYPGVDFQKYAILGDDIVIGDAQVAKEYEKMILDLGVKTSPSKSLISSRGALEFAKKFRILDRDFSPISVKMLRSIRHSVAWMPVLDQVKVDSLQVSLRLRGASFKTYTQNARCLNPRLNRHWFRHCLIFLSPAGVAKLPLLIWLGLPEGFIPDCYMMGSIRHFLVSSCDKRSDTRLIGISNHFHSSIPDDMGLLAERTVLYKMIERSLKYISWWYAAAMDPNTPLESFLYPPTEMLGVADKRDQLYKIYRYGTLFKCYDYVRSSKVVKPIGVLDKDHRNRLVVHIALWKYI